jgi:transposase InsO family protein
VKRYEFIAVEQINHTICRLCRAMKVSENAYYQWLAGKTYRPSERKKELTQQVKTIFYFHKRRYGARRIAAELKAAGVSVVRSQVGSMLKELGLKAIRPKRFRPRTTDAAHGFGYAENLLKNQHNAPLNKGEVLVGDITYLRLQSGKFCYLATFQDKLTRRIVGWQISETMTSQLVIDALQMARRRFLLKKKAIIDTDRGSQYASVEYRRLLYINGFRQSMSGKANCYDNAQAESFFSRFKAELLENGVFENIKQAKSEVFSYIEGYYNRLRRHSSLGYVSPLEFEKQLRTKQQQRRHESFSY